jgi:ribosome maturation protein SDO1
MKVNGKSFEIAVDLDLAMKLRKGEKVNIQNVLLADCIFTNIKNGSKAGSADLIAAFQTDNLQEVAAKIVQRGDIELPKDYRDEQQDSKRKRIIDWFARNAVDARSSRPFTPDQISKALDQAKINLSNGSAEQLIAPATEALQKIIPLRVEMKKLAIVIPAAYTGKVYGIVNEYKEKEDWLSNGDLKITVSIPIGLQMEFYDKLNSVTHGSALTEEIKEAKK